MTEYDPRQWTSHLCDIEGSMVREILGRVSVCVAWSVIVVLLYQLGPEVFRHLAISSTPHSLVGAALGLLLVFRTNSSYDRFWEGRKLWGGIVNETRNLVRQISVWIASDPELARDLINWTILFPYTTVQRLGRPINFDAELKVISSSDIEVMLKSRHLPLAVSRVITSRILSARDRGLIDSIQLSALDHNVQQLIDYCGACERIRSTPIPYAYAVHLRRVLIAFCLTLPMAVVKDFGWATVFVTLLISYALFGIEEIGVEIEDPFGDSMNDLPIPSYCEAIEGVLGDVRDTMLTT